jgi:dTDP-4-amino-4,6-dideoxygalactose transaminase
LGARPVFVDIEANYFSLDVGQVAERCTDKTKAIIPVHIYGHPVDMDPLLNLANERGIAVVEDAAQAHGARYREQAVGSLGKVGCFSFYPGKNLGAYGDAGGIISDDDELVGRMRQLRNHGQDPRRKFWYNDLGYNHRMDGLQGAVLEVKLRYLDQGNQRRRQVAARYDALADLEQVAVPLVADYAHHVYHLYVIRVPDRDALGTALKEEGVATAVQYPHPLHLTTAYEFLGYREGDLPVCEQACREIISLPMFADLEDGQVDYVVDCVRQYYA